MDELQDNCSKSTYLSNLMLTCIFIVGFFSSPNLQARSTIEIPHANADIKIDGKLDDKIWENARKVTLDYQTHPQENTTPSVRTEAYLAENGHQLLLGFKAFDPSPETIRAFLRDRDSAYSDDFIGVVLDTFNDEKRAFEFFANPLGAQMDLINDDVSRKEDDAWNATWEAAGTITNEGYIVEMAIPLNILRFRANLEHQVWGIDLVRFRPRKDRERISITQMDRNKSCYLCQLPKLQGFTNATPSKNIEIIPAFVASQSKSRDLNEQEDWEADQTLEPSLDLRWGISPASTLNMTINPDFSQVEADAAKLNVNRTFALHFPERRPFFLDSADYFKTFENIVHTRNIAEPSIGAKFTNKMGKNTTGLIIADDESTAVLLPRYDGSESKVLETRSQNAIFRYRRDINKQSTLGWITTHRQADDYQNTVVGIDGKYRFGDSDSLQAQILSSQSNNPTQLQENDAGETLLDEEQKGIGAKIRYEHSARNWYWIAEHKQYDKDFRADLGFISKVNYDFQRAGLSYTWHAAKESWWNAVKVYSDWDITHRSDGQLLEKEIQAFISLKGPQQSYIEVFGLNRDKIHEDKMYKQNIFGIYGEFKPKAGVFTSLLLEAADAIDYDNDRAAELKLIRPRLTWNINRHIQLKSDFRFEELSIAQGEVFKASSANNQLTYQFSNKSFLRYTMQRLKVNRNLGLYHNPNDFKQREYSTNQQLLYSYKITPQTIFFLGYSDGGIETDEFEKFTKNNRAVFLKMSYAWLPN